MKIYNNTTKELFGCISFVSPFAISRRQKKIVKIVRIKKYFYVFPQKSYVWGVNARRGLAYKEETNYYIFVWHVNVIHTRTSL